MKWLLLWFGLLVTPGYAEELYFIDAHSQVDHKVDDLSLIIQRMDEFNVRKTILATRGRRPPFDVADLAERYPDKIIPAVRSKSGAYKKDKGKYYDSVSQQFSDSRFRAVAEVLLYHAQKGDKAGEVIVYFGDSRVEAVMQPALDRKIPFIIHIEFASLTGDDRAQFMQGLKQVLGQYPEHPFLLIHMGQLQPAEAEPLLKQYQNFYLITSHADPITVNSSSQPWTNMFQGGLLKDEWQELMKAYPGQFVFALDNVWADHWRNTYGQHMRIWQAALKELPDDVAHAIAHGNAERLWHLQ